MLALQTSHITSFFAGRHSFLRGVREGQSSQRRKSWGPEPCKRATREANQTGCTVGISFFSCLATERTDCETGRRIWSRRWQTRGSHRKGYSLSKRPNVSQLPPSSVTIYSLVL